MDSAGVGELVAGLRDRAALRAPRLKLLNASERVHSTLYIARLLPDLRDLPDEKDALDRFGGQPSRRRRSFVLGFGQPRDARSGPLPTTFSSIEHSGQLMVSPTSSS